MRIVANWPDIHSRQTFMRADNVLGVGPISSHGVMQVKFTRNYTFTCGSDGRLLQRRYEISSQFCD